MALSEPTKGDPSRSASRWVIPYLGALNCLTAIGNLGLVSVMPAIGRDLRIPDFLVASIFSLSALVWAISSPFWIAPVSRYGANFFIRLGLVGFIASMGGCALAVTLGGVGWTGPIATFALFLVLRSIYGASGSAAATATQAFVAARTQGPERTLALTALSGAVSLGTIIGPAIAPFLMFRPIGSVGPMAVFAAIGLVALAASYVFLPGPTVARINEAPASHRSLKSVWLKPVVGRYLMFGLVLCSAQAMNLYTLGFVLIDRSGSDVSGAQSLIGGAMMGGAIAAVAAQWGLGRVLPLTAQRLMQAGAAIGLLGNAIAILIPASAGAVIGFIVASFGFGMARPGFTSAASLAATDAEQVAVGSSVSLIAGASITAPPIVAALAYQFWGAAPFAIPAAMLLALLAGNFAMRGSVIVLKQR
jgi:MFS family permease